MSLFLRRLALFLVVVAALGAGLQALTLHALRKNEKSLQDAAWQEEAATAETLIIGDSHARESIDGRLIPGGFVYAAGGEHLPFTAAKLRWALASRPTPALRHVVLDLGLQSFTAAASLPMDDEWYYARFTDHWAMAAAADDYPDYFRSLLRGSVVPWAGKAQVVLPLLDRARRKPLFAHRDQLALLYDAGWGAFSAQTDQAGLARQRARDHLAGRPPFHPAPVAALGAIRELCRERGLTLTILDAPVTDLYYREMSRLVDPARYAGTLAEELVAHGIVPLDLHGLSADRHELFRDPDHVLAALRREVTARVAAALASAQVPR